MEFIWLLSGTILGAIIGWLIAKSKYNQPDQATEQLKTQLQLAEEKNKMVAQEMQDLKPSLSQEREKSLELSKQLTATQTEYKNLQERLAEQKAEMEKLNERFSI